MIIIYIDILLLVILLFLTIFMCGYCVYRVYTLRQNGEIEILLKPTKVVFSHKREGESTEELRTVVAYQNPFTGDYCVHKSRVGPKGYENAAQAQVSVPDSPDSGVSDEYEPLSLEPLGPPGPLGKLGPRPRPLPPLPHVLQDSMPEELMSKSPAKDIKLSISPKHDDNSVNKTWNWNYKEYQI